MKHIELLGNSIKEDIDKIKREIDNNMGVVFVYLGENTLYNYIDALYDKGRGLNEEYLYKFKVCYEKKDLKVSYSAEGNKDSKNIMSMSSLIDVLDSNNSCKIVVESNDRVQLAFIVQQLIFIEYPLEKVDILLRKEERDADKTKRFMENVDKLLESCDKAIKHLEKLRNNVENYNKPTELNRLKDIDDVLDSCRAIKTQIEKSINVELKFAVMASKKAGKSVIVNCFLGEQIAPTSTELATPNNCFYKRSDDNKYHLQLEGGAVQDFEHREDIYDTINKYFRKAQDNKEKGFALPDMHIRYVTKENNFSSYTIFDTAGSDAAGTTHAAIAERAMQMCDVAVFAIDYSKYLTTSEEEYLRHVKSVFTAQNKFHSLIFALNKIDVRYTDTNIPKSFVLSVDFLKTRLADIDEAYRDCIIFPTCSLEYFSAIEAEKAGVEELTEERRINEMRDIKFAHREVSTLAWLHTHAENLEYYHGIKTISYDVFKKDSGMPALMSYVSYVARSKARDEIVNNVTFKIASQKMKIQSVLNYIANIDELINADDEKIKEISEIITRYINAVETILSPNFNKDDLDVLNKKSSLKLFNGDYTKVIERQREVLKHEKKSDTDDAEDPKKMYKKSVAEDMYNLAVESMWENISNCDEIDGNQIDNLFTVSDFKNVANKIANKKAEDAKEDTFKLLEGLRDDVKEIAKKRQEMLYTESENCRKSLEKKNINIELPGLPEFEFATKMLPLSKVNVSVENIDFKLYQKLSDIFKKKFFENIKTFFLELFGNAREKDYKRKLPDHEEFIKACKENFKKSFKIVVYENNIPDELEEKIIESVVEQYMKDLVEELKKVFNDMNETYMSCVERFRSIVDDRDKYKADIELHNLRKSNIESIKNCTSDFMKIWENIISNDKNMVYER